MPELPEVETIRASLDGVVVGRTVARVELRTPRLRLPLDATLTRAITGRRIEATSRRGKYLLFELDDGQACDAAQHACRVHEARRRVRR